MNKYLPIGTRVKYMERRYGTVCDRREYSAWKMRIGKGDIQPGDWVFVRFDSGEYDGIAPLSANKYLKKLPTHPCFCNPRKEFQGKCFECIPKLLP